jgi:S1-C subfamily serine protease
MEQGGEERTASADSEETPKPSTDDAVSVEEMGVSVQAVTAQSTQEYDLPRETRGVLVTEVDPNGPAYGSIFSLSEGGPDVIQSVEGTVVRTEAELRAALKGAGKGAIVTLKIFNPQAATRIVRIRLQ